MEQEIYIVSKSVDGWFVVNVHGGQRIGSTSRELQGALEQVHQFCYGTRRIVSATTVDEQLVLVIDRLP